MLSQFRQLSISKTRKNIAKNYLLCYNKTMDIKKEIAKSIKFDFSFLDANIEDLIIESISADKGDFCLPCFSMAKVLKNSPQNIAAEIQKTVELGGVVEKCEIIAGYLNFFLNKTEVSKLIINEMSSATLTYDNGQNKTICIDYSSVNLAKYMHIGHLSTTVIGNCLRNIFNFLGQYICSNISDTLL